MPTFWSQLCVTNLYRSNKIIFSKKKKKKRLFLAVDILKAKKSGSGFMSLNAFYNVRLKLESGSALT